MAVLTEMTVGTAERWLYVVDAGTHPDIATGNKRKVAIVSKFPLTLVDDIGSKDLPRPYVAHSETPFVTEMVASASDPNRFEQPTPFGPYVMEIVIEHPEPDRLTYAWWWAEAGQPPTEQSKAETRRSA